MILIKQFEWSGARNSSRAQSSSPRLLRAFAPQENILAGDFCLKWWSLLGLNLLGFFNNLLNDLNLVLDFIFLNFIDDLPSKLDCEWVRSIKWRRNLGIGARLGLGRNLNWFFLLSPFHSGITRNRVGSCLRSQGQNRSTAAVGSTSGLDCAHDFRERSLKTRCIGGLCLFWVPTFWRVHLMVFLRSDLLDDSFLVPLCSFRSP